MIEKIETTGTREMIETSDRTETRSARPALLWATQPRAVERRADTPPEPPEATIARIADLLAHGFARPSDAVELRRAAEAVRGLRERVEGLEAEVGRLAGGRNAGGAGGDEGSEAERLVREFRVAGI